MMIILFLLLFLRIFILVESTKTFTITMPDVSPKEKESYLCTSKELPPGDMYGVNFRPLADMETAHHILLFGCSSKPQSAIHKDYWSCGFGSVCGGKQIILYAWAKNAKDLQLPNNVGFKLGSAVGINYITLQVHYARPLDVDEVDGSGVSIALSGIVPKFAAGVYLLESHNFAIPPKSIGYHTDSACVYDGRPIMPFAFRTHAHARGRSISAYRIRNGEWVQIGIGSPQRAQAFYPIDKSKRLVIKKGDIIAARCTYDSPDSNIVIKPGSFSQDEMCNFYMMVYIVNKHGAGANIPQMCSSYNIKLPSPFPDDSSLPDPLTGTSNHGSLETTANTYTTTQHLKTTVKTSPTHQRKQTTKTTATTTTTATVKQSKSSQPRPVLDSTWSFNDVTVGHVAGLAMHTNEHLVVLHQSDATWNKDSFDPENFYIGKNEAIKSHTLLHVERKTGKITKSFGRNLFYLPYGLTVDHDGNYWITDLALHQVFKLAHDHLNSPVLSLGIRSEPGNDRKHFCKPADVAVDKRGFSYVADGFCNNRIMKFSPDGKHLYHWGEKDSTSGSSNAALDSPHSISIDDDSKLLYVCDRHKSRIQVYNLRGNYVRSIYHREFGTVLTSITFNPQHGGVLYALAGKNDENGAKGFTILTSTGEIINAWGTDERRTFSTPSALIVSPDDSSLFVADVSPHTLWKFNIENPNGTQQKHGKLPFKIESLESIIDSPDNNNEPKHVTDFKDDDVSMVPAIVVVVVLATPIVLVFVAAIVQHLRFKRKRTKAVKLRNQRKTLRHGSSKNHELCFGCLGTPKYYYNTNNERRFGNNLLHEDSDVTTSDDDGGGDSEEDLFTRKA